MGYDNIPFYLNQRRKKMEKNLNLYMVSIKHKKNQEKKFLNSDLFNIYEWILNL